MFWGEAHVLDVKLSDLGEKKDSMKIELFQSEKHLFILHKWLDIRGMARSFTNALPKLGFIGFEGTTPIVAAFLRHIEPDMAMFDSLITNPETEAPLRNEAIDEITKYILHEVVPSYISKIIGFTSDKHTEERAWKYGFKTVDCKMVVLDL